MALHGKTSIELYDAKTGKLTDKVEKDNFITDGVQQHLLHGLNLFQASNMGHSRILDAFRGLIIFNKNIDATKTEPEFTPTMYTSIVGFGNNNQRVAGNSYMGSFNDAESDLDVSKKSIKLVWDFSTDACNDDIGAICLAPVGATPNDFISYNTGLKAPYVRLGFDINFGNISSGANYFTTTPTYFYYSISSVRYRVKRTPLAKEIHLNYDTTSYLGETYVINIPSEIIDGFTHMIAYYLDSTDIDIYYKLTSSSGLYDIVYRVIHTDFTYTDYNVKVKSSYTLHNMSFSFNYYSMSGLNLKENKYTVTLFVKNQDNETDIYSVSIDTTTGEIVSDEYMFTTQISNISTNYAVATRANFCTDFYTSIFKLSGYSEDFYLVYNPTTKEFAYIKQYAYLSNPLSITSASTFFYNSGSYAYLYVYNNFVTTVNNQDDILTKTPDKTMKIVYTITEE